MRRRVRILAGVIGLLAVVAFVTRGHPNAYVVRMKLTNADGLITGAPVEIGGVEVGRVASLSIDRHDEVIVALAFDRSRGPMGRGVRATVRASNLLGSKVVDVQPGDRSKPVPSGYLLSPDHTGTSVDLQDVLDVLDTGTRARLAILINEAGLAMTGRRADFNALLRRLPSSLDRATALLRQVDADDTALRRVVERSDSLVGRVTHERAAVGRFVAVGGETMRTVAVRRAALRETLKRAPATLRSAQRFLTDLRGTTTPLGPAARALTASAPPLTETLARIGPFEAAARPALRQAISVAPQLTALGLQATPVVRRAVPTARTLNGFASDLAPASSAANLTVDDLLSVLEGWSRSIQSRDGISHFFRANISISPDLIQSLVDKGSGSKSTTTAARRGSSHTPGSTGPPRSGNRSSARPRAAHATPAAGGMYRAFLNYLLAP